MRRLQNRHVDIVGRYRQDMGSVTRSSEAEPLLNKIEALRETIQAIIGEGYVDDEAQNKALEMCVEIHSDVHDALV